VATAQYGDSVGYAPRGSAGVYGHISYSVCGPIAFRKVALITVQEARRPALGGPRDTRKVRGRYALGFGLEDIRVIIVDYYSCNQLVRRVEIKFFVIWDGALAWLTLVRGWVGFDLYLGLLCQGMWMCWTKGGWLQKVFLFGCVFV
jgi:hypothetical protein